MRPRHFILASSNVHLLNWSARVILLLWLCSCTACQRSTPTSRQQTPPVEQETAQIELERDFSASPVSIRGEIVGYKGIYKTGKLTFFDAVTRTPAHKIFTIDDDGKFQLTFNIHHPVTGSVYFDVENQYYGNLLVEPDSEYDIELRNGKLAFQGKSGKKNRELNSYYNAFFKKFGKDIRELKRLSGMRIPVEEILDKQKQFETKALEFVFNYQSEHGLDDQLSRLVSSEIRYKTAHAWINARYDYSEPGKRKLRSDLPSWYYERLFSEYTVENREDYQSRAAMDYLSNIVSVLAHESSTRSRVEFFMSQNCFTVDETKMYERALNMDADVLESGEYKRFKASNLAKIRELNLRFTLKNVLDSASKLGQNVGRDLVVSQAVSKYCLANNISPTATEWERISALISEPEILQFLRDYQSNNKRDAKAESESDPAIANNIVAKSVAQIEEKYFQKHRGKVVYVDVYSTWCGPCRREIPFAKALHEEFIDEDVAFVNLCAKSKKEDWVNLVKQYEIEGENYCLNDEDFALLSKILKIDGFPTYILLNQDGEVVDYSAPAPSDRQAVVEKIRQLLSENDERSTKEADENPLAEALRTAKKQDKHVLVELHGRPWCPPCVNQQKTLIQSSEFQEWVAKNTVLLQIKVGEDYDPGKGHKSWAGLFKKYKLRSIPAMVLLRSDGSHLGTLAPESTPKKWIANAELVISQ